MFAEEKKLMARRETWIVFQAWEAQGDFFFLLKKIWFLRDDNFKLWPIM